MVSTLLFSCAPRFSSREGIWMSQGIPLISILCLLQVDACGGSICEKLLTQLSTVRVASQPRKGGFIRKDDGLSWRGGSLIKLMYCSCREPDFISQHSHWEAHNICNLSSRSNTLFWLPRAIHKTV